MHLRRVLPVVLVMFVLFAACSREEAAESTTTTATVPEADIKLSVISVESNGTAPPTPELVDAMVATLDDFVADAIIAPLQTGVVGSDLAVSFTPGAAAQLDGDDREALVHEHLPGLPRVRAQRANIALSTLAGPDGEIGVMVARLDLAIRATGEDDDLDITHAGDFVFVPDGATWKIDSYTMHTTRERHPEPTTSTTSSKKKKEDDE
jgi:hypothetical protein